MTRVNLLSILRCFVSDVVYIEIKDSAVEIAGFISRAMVVKTSLVMITPSRSLRRGEILIVVTHKYETFFSNSSLEDREGHHSALETLLSMTVAFR